jgi:hypothetical protein
MNKKIILFCIFALIVGIVIGGYLFRDVKPRSFLSADSCNDCLNPNQLLGLIGSIGVQKSPDFIPLVVRETDKTIVMDSPVHKASIHYVIIPKKDIKDISDISEEDKDYIIDAYAVIGQIIREENLTKYKIYTNGPSYQTVNYLHFHLMSEDVDK